MPSLQLHRGTEMVRGVGDEEGPPFIVGAITKRIAKTWWWWLWSQEGNGRLLFISLCFHYNRPDPLRVVFCYYCNASLCLVTFLYFIFLPLCFSCLRGVEWEKTGRIPLFLFYPGVSSVHLNLNWSSSPFTFWWPASQPASMATRTTTTIAIKFNSQRPSQVAVFFFPLRLPGLVHTLYTDDGHYDKETIQYIPLAGHSCFNFNQFAF